MNIRPTVYLAGPITSLSYGETTDWRELAARLLAPHILAYSPMRGKDYLAGEDSVRDHYTEYALSTPKLITLRDRRDAMTCDLMLVNLLGAKKVSIGTMIEIGWADAQRTPIIAVIDEGNPHEHGILQQIVFAVDNLESAVILAKGLLLP